MRRFAACILMMGMMAGSAYASATPTVTAVSPASGTINGGTTVMLTGSNFNNDNVITVTFNGAVPQNGSGIVIVNGTTLFVTTPAHASGAVTISATNTAVPPTGTSAGNLFTFTNANVNVQVSVIVTIPQRADLGWGTQTTADDAGTAHGTGAYTAGSASAYVWKVADPEFSPAFATNPNATYRSDDATNNKKMTISNVSRTNSTESIHVSATNTLNWTLVNVAPTANQFELEMSLSVNGLGAFTPLTAAPQVLAGALLPASGTANDMIVILRFTTPPTITVGAGVAQTSTVTLAATAP